MNQLAQIMEVMNQEILPVIFQHGGNLYLKKYENGTVYISLGGACAGCPSADQGTRLYIEQTLKQRLSFVKKVEIYHPVNEEMLSFARKILNGKGSR